MNNNNNNQNNDNNQSGCGNIIYDLIGTIILILLINSFG